MTNQHESIDVLPREKGDHVLEVDETETGSRAGVGKVHCCVGVAIGRRMRKTLYWAVSIILSAISLSIRIRILHSRSIF